MLKAIYTLRADSNRYKSLVIPDITDRKKFELMDGRTLHETWLPPKVDVDREEGRGEFSTGDFPSLLRHAPVFSTRAIEELGGVLKKHGEVLPLVCKNCEGGPYFVYNLTTIVDALDKEKSEIKYFSTGRVMRVVRYAFLDDKLNDFVIFKIPELPKSEVFVTDRFISAVESSHLSGFQFERV